MTNEPLHPLGRLPEFDARSLAFPIADKFPDGAEPRTQFWACDVRLNQGSEGACVGFGWAAELAATPVVIPFVTNDIGFDIYHRAQLVDEWPGEDYEGTSVLAGAKTVASLGYLTEYRWAFSLDDLVLAISYQGPAIIGINWYQGMDSIGADGIAHLFGSVRGGHCVCVIGVDIGQRLFRIQNSWGQGWGQDGRCWITFDDMQRLLSEHGDACIPIKRVGPEDPPIPPPIPPEPEPVSMEVVDARSQVSKQEGFGPMNANPDIIIHHTAGASLAGATVAQEVAHIQAINSQHINAGFGGFAYHGITFPSGRSYWCATFNRYRAHIQDRNPEFIGWVLAGTFTNVMPGAAQLAGLKVALKFIRSSIATGPGIFGHGQKAVPGAGTSCPGVVANINWEEFLEEDELTDEEKRIIADRNGRVAFAWGSTNEFNLWFDEATRIIHAYDPGSQEEVGSIRLRNLPPKLQPVTADALPPERLGV